MGTHDWRKTIQETESNHEYLKEWLAPDGIGHLLDDPYRCQFLIDASALSFHPQTFIDPHSPQLEVLGTSPLHTPELEEYLPGLAPLVKAVHCFTPQGVETSHRIERHQIQRGLVQPPAHTQTLAGATDKAITTMLWDNPFTTVTERSWKAGAEGGSMADETSENGTYQADSPIPITSHAEKTVLDRFATHIGITVGLINYLKEHTSNKEITDSTRAIAVDALYFLTPLLRIYRCPHLLVTLQDLCFQAISPYGYAEALHNWENKYGPRLEPDKFQEEVTRLEDLLNSRLIEHGVVCEVKGRQKSLLSTTAKIGEGRDTRDWQGYTVTLHFLEDEDLNRVDSKELRGKAGIAIEDLIHNVLGDIFIPYVDPADQAPRNTYLRPWDNSPYYVVDTNWADPRTGRVREVRFTTPMAVDYQRATYAQFKAGEMGPPRISHDGRDLIALSDVTSAVVEGWRKGDSAIPCAYPDSPERVERLTKQLQSTTILISSEGFHTIPVESRRVPFESPGYALYRMLMEYANRVSPQSVHLITHFHITTNGTPKGTDFPREVIVELNHQKERVTRILYSSRSSEKDSFGEFVTTSFWEEFPVESFDLYTGDVVTAMTTYAEEHTRRRFSYPTNSVVLELARAFPGNEGGAVDRYPTKIVTVHSLLNYMAKVAMASNVSKTSRNVWEYLNANLLLPCTLDEVETWMNELKRLNNLRTLNLSKYGRRSLTSFNKLVEVVKLRKFFWDSILAVRFNHGQRFDRKHLKKIKSMILSGNHEWLSYQLGLLREASEFLLAVAFKYTPLVPESAGRSKFISKNEISPWKDFVLLWDDPTLIPSHPDFVETMIDSSDQLFSSIAYDALRLNDAMYSKGGHYYMPEFEVFLELFKKYLRAKLSHRSTVHKRFVEIVEEYLKNSKSASYPHNPENVSAFLDMIYGNSPKRNMFFDRRVIEVV